MDSETIRREIEAARRRIDERLQELENRSRQAARRVVRWTLVAAGVATIGVIGATIAWRYARRRQDTRTRRRPPETLMLPFGPIGVARRHTKSRSTA